MFEFEVETDTVPMSFGVSPEGNLVMDKQAVKEALDYEVAYEAMGGKGGGALGMFLSRWKNSPVSALHLVVLLEGRLIPKHMKREDGWYGPANVQLTTEEQGISSMLVLDYGEHVLVEFEKRHPQIKRPRSALQEARDCLEWQLDQMRRGVQDDLKRLKVIDELECSEESMVDIIDAAIEIERVGGAEWVVFDGFLKALKAWRRWDYGMVSSAAAHAVQAMATAQSGGGVLVHIDDHTDYSDDCGELEFVRSWKSAARAEQRWQVRRFVDVLTALRAGEPRPPVQATR